MAIRTRLLTFALAASMVAGTSKALARKPGAVDRSRIRPDAGNTRRTQPRIRHQTLPTSNAPIGSHHVRVDNGNVLVNGRPIRRGAGESAWLLGDPVWRQDGMAVAWLERSHGDIRLVVVPDVAGDAEPLVWVIPVARSEDQLTWVGSQRIHVGALPFAPKAVAT